jgi:hypothetical protein
MARGVAGVGLLKQPHVEHKKKRAGALLLLLLRPTTPTPSATTIATAAAMTNQTTNGDVEGTAPEDTRIEAGNARAAVYKAYQ